MHDSTHVPLQASVCFCDAGGGSAGMKGAGEAPHGSVMERHQCAKSL